ncbi:twin-arginine translocase subunit TatC [Thermodesulfobacteriota bacterium]
MSILSEYFAEHLQELRGRVLKSFVAIGLATAIAYYYSEALVHFLMDPLFVARPNLAQLVYTNLTEAFIAYLKVSLLFGILFSFPVLCYQMWMFIAPGLHKKEKKTAIMVVFLGTGLFASGACFAYFVVMPEALSFLMGAGDLDIEPLPKMDGYLSFVARTALAFGLAFEIPFLMTAAAKTGIVDPTVFIRQRMYYYIAILVTAFLLTAGDVFSAVLVTFPLIGLYEAGILVTRVFSSS